MGTAQQVIDKVLERIVTIKASDLHLGAGSSPLFRTNGTLTNLEIPPLKPEMVETMVWSLLTAEQKEQFEREKEAVLKKLCNKPRGLVLVTGPTGSGKSTTLAAMIDYINENRSEHIVTIEDPIEFLHRNKKSLIRQRELGADTNSFAAALKHILRQDPDVILVGEMRDLETISLAVTAAETEHLVFATVHTIGAPATVDRVVDVFPPHQQQQIRMQLSIILEGVVSQVLIPRIDGTGRVCALEIMVGTVGVRNLIREGKTHQLTNIIQSGPQHGMHTLDTSLKSLYQKGIIGLEEAVAHAANPNELRLTASEGSQQGEGQHVSVSA
jgi:twitching motility protein PilT